VVGKTLNITSDKLLLTISGVAKDFPANSSFKFDIVIPRMADPYYNDELKRGTNSFNDLLMIRLVKGTNVNMFQKKLDAFSTRYFKTLTESMAKQDPKNKPEDFHVYLRPFAEAHYNQSENWNHYTDLKKHLPVGLPGDNYFIYCLFKLYPANTNQCYFPVAGCRGSQNDRSGEKADHPSILYRNTIAGFYSSYSGFAGFIYMPAFL